MQEVTINLPDEVYQRVVKYAQKQKISIEEVILRSIYAMLSEELPNFQTELNSNTNKSSNLL